MYPQPIRWEWREWYWPIRRLNIYLEYVSWKNSNCFKTAKMKTMPHNIWLIRWFNDSFRVKISANVDNKWIACPRKKSPNLYSEPQWFFAFESFIVNFFVEFCEFLVYMLRPRSNLFRVRLVWVLEFSRKPNRCSVTARKTENFQTDFRSVTLSIGLVWCCSSGGAKDTAILQSSKRQKQFLNS